VVMRERLDDVRVLRKISNSPTEAKERLLDIKVRAAHNLCWWRGQGGRHQRALRRGWAPRALDVPSFRWRLAPLAPLVAPPLLLKLSWPSVSCSYHLLPRSSSSTTALHLFDEMPHRTDSFLIPQIHYTEIPNKIRILLYRLRLHCVLLPIVFVLQFSNQTPP
jgi:hypothetical protein